jgi:predicted RNase H-like HicB family nuclease
MSTERKYKIVLRPESEGGFSVFVPELPRVAAQSETIEEATEMAMEAIEAYPRSNARGRPPMPTVHRGSVAVHAAWAPCSPAVSGKQVVAALARRLMSRARPAGRRSVTVIWPQGSSRV